MPSQMDRITPKDLQDLESHLVHAEAKLKIKKGCCLLLPLSDFLTTIVSDSHDRQRSCMQRRLDSINDLLQSEATVATEPQFPQMAALSPSFVSQTAFQRAPIRPIIINISHCGKIAGNHDR